MESGKKAVISSVVVVLVVLIIAFMISQKGSFTGFAVYSGGCSNTINDGGYWELNDTLGDCAGNGVVINASNVTFDCKNYAFYSNSSAANTIGFYVESGLNGVVLQNCNISSYSVAVFAGSAVLIKDSSTNSASCVQGDWTSGDGNLGCLDNKGPVVMGVIDQEITNNESLSYQVNASDSSGVANYTLTVDNNETSFSIDNTGLIVNTTENIVGNYTFNLSVSDQNGISTDLSFKLTVTEPVIVVVDNTENTTTDDTVNKTKIRDKNVTEDTVFAKQPLITQAAIDACWSCSNWSFCYPNGTKTMECNKIQTGCDIGRPITVKTCTPCIEDWQCEFSDCGGLRLATSCVDANNCGSDFNKPTTGQCAQENASATAGVTGRAVQTGGNGSVWFIVFVVIVIAVAVLFKYKGKALLGFGKDEYGKVAGKFKGKGSQSGVVVVK